MPPPNQNHPVPPRHTSQQQRAAPPPPPPPAEPEMMAWDSPISPGEPKELHPEGRYSFEVLSFKRDRRTMGSLGLCNIAVLSVLLTPQGQEEPAGKMSFTLALHANLQWKLYGFFTAIGQRQHGDTETFIPDWPAVPGSVGYCYLTTRKFAKRDEDKANKSTWTGEENDIKKFLSFEEFNAAPPF